MQSLLTGDGLPIPETVFCDEHAESPLAYGNAIDFAENYVPDWDKNDEFKRVDSVTANRAGLRCQICGDQDASD